MQHKTGLEYATLFLIGLQGQVTSQEVHVDYIFMILFAVLKAVSTSGDQLQGLPFFVSSYRGHKSLAIAQQS